MAHPKFCNSARIKCKREINVKSLSKAKEKSQMKLTYRYTILGTLPKVIIIRKKLSQKFAYTLLRQTLALC